MFSSVSVEQFRGDLGRARVVAAQQRDVGGERVGLGANGCIGVRIAGRVHVLDQCVGVAQTADASERDGAAHGQPPVFARIAAVRFGRPEPVGRRERRVVLEQHRLRVGEAAQRRVQRFGRREALEPARGILEDRRGRRRLAAVQRDRAEIEIDARDAECVVAHLVQRACAAEIRGRLVELQRMARDDAASGIGCREHIRVVLEREQLDRLGERGVGVGVALFAKIGRAERIEDTGAQTRMLSRRAGDRAMLRIACDSLRNRR